MRIESSTVENHRFGVARRRGYDAAEVDSVMSRVADTLAQYERMLQRLESSAATATSSNEVVESSGGPQDSASELLTKARAAAAHIVEAATSQAEAIRNEATTTADRIIGAAEDHLAGAQVDAQRIREEADSLIDVGSTRSEELRSQAETILTSAIADAEKVREDAESFVVAQASEAEQMLHFAQTEANRLTAEATQMSDDAHASTNADVADVLAQAREQAESMINSAVEEAQIMRERAQSEMEELRASREGRAEELIGTARNEAAEIRAAAAATAEAVMSQGRVSSEEALAEARAQALERLTTAQEEAEDLLHQASREADSTVTAAREDNRRLERRMEQLRAGVTEFEAHIANLGQVAGDRAHLITDMIDQQISSKPTPPQTSTNPGAQPPDHTAEQAAAAEEPDAVPREELAEPDGSGQLPAKRPTVEAQSNPLSETGGADDVDLRADLEAEFVYDGATARPDEATDTIYQRRGGGIRRRVAAIDTPDDGDAD
jgi:DivIVA domain-containing protein